MKRQFQFVVLRCVVAASLCWVACVLSDNVGLAQAQIKALQLGCSGDGTACPGIAIVGVQGKLEVVKNQPYQAQAATEIKRTLADGSHTDQTITAMIARDSDGRTVRTQTFSNGTTVTMILDPVAGTHIDYDSEKKIAHVMTLPATLPSGAALAMGSGFFTSAGGQAGGGFFLEHRTVSSQASDAPSSTTESLGTKTIDGIPVAGTRSTSTIPLGAIGNDKELTITREAWYSAELKLDLSTIQNDPRFGQTTYSLTNIQRSEPDAALFQAPPDYKIEEIKMPEPPR
jgi:hypothetical protein